jgi:Thiamine pyrophosphate enzyme, C-terminal TPP binding domain
MPMGEFATRMKYRLPVKVVIIKNNSLGMIKWEQMVFLGHPEYGCEAATGAGHRRAGPGRSGARGYAQPREDCPHRALG